MAITNDELKLVKEKLFVSRALSSKLSVLQAQAALAQAEYIDHVESLRAKYDISPSMDLSIDDGEWKKVKDAQ